MAQPLHPQGQAKRKTTELVEPEIKHGDHGVNQYRQERDALEGKSHFTIADYGFTTPQEALQAIYTHIGII